jgi:phosphatidylserine/phosphatidylglycerophosphate/cardiolipin synthase-like enzyme
MVIDGEHTITGSFNFTDAAQEQNDENVLLIHDRSLAALYQGEFERVYDQALNPTDCEE